MSRDAAGKRRLILPLATEPYARDFQDTDFPPPTVDPDAATQPIYRHEAPTVRTRRATERKRQSDMPSSGRYSHVYPRNK
jgi:hypothetical protein